MKWSMFIMKTELNNSSILYNTINDGMVEIPKLELENINRFLSNVEKLNEVYKKDWNALVAGDFIIDSDVDEKKDYLERLKADYLQMDQMPLMIITTTSCNFNCPYCYEDGIERSHSFSLEKCEKLLEYLENYLLANSKIKRVLISFYGGEPTLNFKAIKYLLPKLKQMFYNNKIEYDTSIVTNGYLLDDSTAAFLSKYNWVNAQITLDGTKKVHNSRRHLKDGSGTFNQIIENINNIIKKEYLSEVNIRLNIDENNCDNMLQLLEYLKTKLDISKIHLSLGLITKTVNDDTNINYINNCLISEKHYSQFADIFVHAKQMGFQLFDYYFTDGLCMAKNPYTLAINADGNIYKCVSLIGRNRFSSASIFSEDYSGSSYMDYGSYEYCFNRQCPLIPACNCGCPFQALINNGSMQTIFCEYEKVKMINELIQKKLHGEEI